MARARGAWLPREAVRWAVPLALGAAVVVSAASGCPGPPRDRLGPSMVPEIVLPDGPPMLPPSTSVDIQLPEDTRDGPAPGPAPGPGGYRVEEDGTGARPLIGGEGDEQWIIVPVPAPWPWVGPPLLWAPPIWWRPGGVERR